jgi:preprotein translocase subunit SecB
MFNKKDNKNKTETADKNKDTIKDEIENIDKNKIEDNKQPEFAIQKIYTKDFSYEAPGTPAIFTEEWKPNVKLDININREKLDDSIYEIILRTTVTATKEDKTFFIVELKQAGIFILKNFTEPQIEQLCSIDCPTILFPYASESISTMITKGGFPPVLLTPVNFNAMYQQHKEQQLLAAESPSKAKH